VLFNSWSFFIFFAAILLLAAPLSKYGRAWRILVLAASYFFYGQWSWVYCSLIIASTLVDFGLALAIDRSAKPKRYLVISIVANLGLLAFFKYANFLIASFNAGLTASGASLQFSALDIVLPVGISFFTFQAMSYTIDVYRKEMPARRNLLDYALYIAFFPQLLAGPIVRAKEFFHELDFPKALALRDVQYALILITLGMVKKVVCADNLAESFDAVWLNPAQHPPSMVLAAVYAFAAQIYFDFSGYTDIAIGVALLLGFRFPKNFDYPYAAITLQDFWRRWHMTLSRWLRDYLYIALGGNRISGLRTYVNLGATMLLGGLWHGASWNFVIWGALHGLYLGVERALGWDKPSEHWVVNGLRWALTFHLVCFAWIFFRAPTFAASTAMIARIAELVNNVQGLQSVVLPVVGLLLYQSLARRVALKDKLANANALVFAIVVSAAFLALVVLAPARTAPFIYFQF
jgi:alginate O-acetyltransferase complex protein AlgI